MTPTNDGFDAIRSALVDMVAHPPHYTQGGIECIDALRESLGLEGFSAYCRGAALKYLWRCDYKGRRVEDLRKAAWYINRLIEELEKAG